MRQAVLTGIETIEVVDRPTDEPGPRDVRIEVVACGVCGSDLPAYFHGHYVNPGQVMGHEVVGRVTRAGADIHHLDVGDLVVARPVRTCETCWYCTRGDSHLCARSASDSIGYGADGGFADSLMVKDEAHHRQLLRVAQSTPAEDAIWAEPLAVCLHAIARTTAGPGTRALVIGAGPLGLGLVAACTQAGMLVEVSEPRAARRDAALQLGATAAYDPVDAPSTAVDVAFDASGSPLAIAAAAERVAPGGELVLVGLSDAGLPPSPPGVRVRGSFSNTAADFERAVRLIDSGAVRLGSAVTHWFDVAQVAAAIDTAAHDSSAIKVGIRSQT